MAWVLMAACGIGSYLLFQGLERELAPQEDRSEMRLFATAPQGRGYAYMQAYVDELERLVQREVPEVKALISVTSPGFGASSSVSSAFFRITLVPPGERERTQDEIANAIQAAARQLPGARVFVSQPATISTGGRGLPVEFVVQAPSLDALREVLPDFMAKANQDPAFQFARVDLEFTLPELQVEVDRDRAQALGVSPLDVAETLQLGLAEARLGYFIRGGEQYEVIAQVKADERASPSDLRSLFVRSRDGLPIPLESLVQTREVAAPPQLYRTDRFTSATISAQPAPGVSLGDALDAMQAIAGETLPSGFTSTLAGQSRDFRESSGQLGTIFGLALVLIYLVLAAQFESFRDPLIILLTVPLALVGALGALGIFGETLNVFSQIGLVMLIGLVTKNGILIVEFARQQREAGRGRARGRRRSRRRPLPPHPHDDALDGARRAPDRARARRRRRKPRPDGPRGDRRARRGNGPHALRHPRALHLPRRRRPHHAGRRRARPRARRGRRRGRRAGRTATRLCRRRRRRLPDGPAGSTDSAGCVTPPRGSSRLPCSSAARSRRRRRTRASRHRETRCRRCPPCSCSTATRCKSHSRRPTSRRRPAPRRFRWTTPSPSRSARAPASASPRSKPSAPGTT